MNELNTIVNYVLVGGLIGSLLASAWFFIKYYLRQKNAWAIKLFQYFPMLWIRYSLLGLERLGFFAYMYLPDRDRKKSYLDELHSTDTVIVNNPLCFEHYKHRNLPVYFPENFIFYSPKTLEVKGYFHRFNSEQKSVFKASLVNIQYRNKKTVKK